mgnify:CR=1 FL=1
MLLRFRLLKTNRKDIKKIYLENLISKKNEMLFCRDNKKQIQL